MRNEELYQKQAHEETAYARQGEKGFRFYCLAVLTLTFTIGCSVTAFAASDPITVVNNLSDFIFGLIRAVGLILLGWGVVQIGLSFQSHDPSQRSQGFLTLAGGVVIIDELCSLPVSAISQKNSILFLWTTFSANYKKSRVIYMGF